MHYYVYENGISAFNLFLVAYSELLETEGDGDVQSYLVVVKLLWGQADLC